MDSVKNILAVPELRRRVLFTFGLLAVYRLGSKIPTPGINTVALEEIAARAAGSPWWSSTRTGSDPKPAPADCSMWWARS